MKYLPSTFCICLIMMLVSPRNHPAQAQSPSQDEWFHRSIVFTDDLIKDADALMLADRALLWARLGNIWWMHDSEKARIWLEKAIETVESSSESERADQQRERLKAARVILSIVSLRDKNLSGRLTALLATDSEKLDKSERMENGRAMANAALSILESKTNDEVDTKRATDIGIAALRAGLASDEFTAIQWELRKRDANSADLLFNEALKIAQATYDKWLLTSLAMIAFPQARYPNFKGDVPSDRLRIVLLETLARGLWLGSKSPEAKVESCQLAPIAAPLLDYFTNLLPQQAGMVRIAVTECQSLLTSRQSQQVSDSIRDVPLKTIEDYLAAAEKAAGLEARINYWMRGAFMAAQQKDYDRAITIIEGISSEARESLGETWENARWDFAVGAALACLKRDDFYEMQQVIASTPIKLRALVQVRVVEQLVASDYRTNAIEMLNEARSGLNKVDISAKADAYILLTRLYAKLLPDDAPSVFNEAVKEINRVGKSNQTTKGKPSLNNRAMWQPINLPASLLATDEQSIRLSLSNIDLPIKRVALRIGFLNAALEQRSTNSQKAIAKPEGKQDGN